MSGARTVIEHGFCQGDFDFNGYKALNIDLTGIIELEFGLQAPNTFFAGPLDAQGQNANPTFRAMVAADLPASAMLTTENLAGLANLATSRTNLGLTTTATAANTATGLLLLNIVPPSLEGTNFLTSVDNVPQWVTPASLLSTIGAEPSLGNPGTNGFILASTTGGVRSWVAQTAAVLPIVDSTAVVKGSVDATKLLRFEVDGFTTGTTRVLTPPNYDGTIATLAGVEAFTNKTYNGIEIITGGVLPEFQIDGDLTVLNSAGKLIIRNTAPSDVTFPIEGTLATLDGVETLTNKTIIGGLALRSSAGAFELSLTTDDDSSRELMLRLNDSDRILYLGGNLSIAGNFITEGAFPVTLTATASTGLTLPTSGTLATLVGTETLANKTLEAVVALGIVNDDSGFDLNIANDDREASADRTLLINLNNVNRDIVLNGNLTLAHNLTTAGAFALTLTTTATSSLTLPTAGTVEARVAAPANAASAGITGQVAFDATHEYRCVATNTWVRVTTATW